MAAITARYDRQADGIALEGPDFEDGVNTISFEDAERLAVALRAILDTVKAAA